MPIAMGRSKAVPLFFISAGARFTTVLVRGMECPMDLIVLSTL
jgi:hypothetical protein